MTGLPNFNAPAFEVVADVLRRTGWEVWSPRENDAALGIELMGLTGDEKLEDLLPGHSYALTMAQDLNAVCTSDAVVVMPGWEYSSGARLEVHVALKVHIPVYTFPEGRLVTQPALEDNSFSSKHVEHVEEAPPSPLDFGPSWRETSPEGTNKGRRQAIFSMIPVYALVQEARVHGSSVMPGPDGEIKYADTDPGVPNWAHGAPWSWFMDALDRHWLAFKAGQSFDTGPGGSGLHQLAHVRWMCGWLMEMERLGKGTDDRRIQV